MNNIENKVTINNMDFSPIPGVKYAHNYVAIVKDIKAKKLDEMSIFRSLILNDLFFIIYFVMRIEIMNRPFIIQTCQEVESGPKDFTLDVWAREHGKTSIITIAETIQNELKYPEKSTMLLSYVKAISKKFLFEIRNYFENSEFLKACFPDVLYQDPCIESRLWNLDDGLILKRKTGRKEPNIYAAGLIEGMPTSLHCEFLVFDDIVTEDMAKSLDIMNEVKNKFDSAQNLGADGGSHRVLGTYYAHNDPLTYIRDKVDANGKPLYLLRLKPATNDGTESGLPVFLSQKRLNDLKFTKTFYCQQLLDPTPRGVRKFDSKFLQEIEHKDIPTNVYRFMAIDPAGDIGNDPLAEDSWGIMVIGIKPEDENISMSNIYIMDATICPFRRVEALEEICRMYIRNPEILQVGVEKIGLSTMEIHVAETLLKYGRRISLENKTLFLLRPKGRNKAVRIEDAISKPLYGSKLFISKNIDNVYRQRIKNELDMFPRWKDDALDVLSYFYDMIIENKYWLKPKQKINYNLFKKTTYPRNESWMVS